METQLALPFTLEDYGGIDAVYVDQAPYRTGWRGYSFSACYTPAGIRNLDQGFCDQIRSFRGKKSYLRLRREITHNPHLHVVIKQNLIENLDSIWKERHKRAGHS